MMANSRQTRKERIRRLWNGCIPELVTSFRRRKKKYLHDSGH